MSPHNFRSVFLAFLLAFTFISPSAFAEDDLIYIEENDPEMEKAIAEARRTYENFFIAQQEKGAELSSFAMKVLIKDPSNGESEHIWLSDITRENDKMTGTIANQPVYITNVKYGDRYDFTLNDLSDWSYATENKMEGNFTMCVLFKVMAEDEVAYYKDTYGYECE
ncbi:YegJ family protein [Thorsellia anophelis]|uniref:Uncharacterized conserved protein YegJ, DUF2314 family n=1 Tax=Thorsellia anophelis DSM 18579 TaxID=1123402 RepID=A0A1H9ZY60_9GAMM|nr:DUF2314 domain-containing protein [Thorsellia anophelis]SES86666.1 Uncharacterized conserved protein YegJ, DUF2314 family [Thorsellia anophelis DSM 18579]